MKEPIISVHNLHKSYGNKTILDRITFEINSGTIFALLGENGAGKTTTIRILTTLIKRDNGQITISGFDIGREANAIRSIISLTGQYAAVDELLTGEENLLMMARLYHLDRRTAKIRTAELLEQFDLVQAAKKAVKSYSGGMRRRLDIAISLLANPEVIFLDEPTTGLDPRSRMKMWKLIQDLANNGVTIFLTTQYLEEADKLADRIAVIHDGKIVEDGTPDELKEIVGSEKLELTFPDKKTLFLAQKIIVGQGQVDETNLCLVVPTSGTTENLRLLLNKLHDGGIEPVSVNYRKPTLDDVFMEITSGDKKGVV